jgi:C-terminal processing protease CtpA/Prc
VLATLAVSFLVSASQPAVRLTAAQVQEDLRALESAITTRWSYYDMRVEKDGLDLKARIQQAIERFPAGADPEPFRQELVRIVAALHDGHANVAVPGAAAPTLRVLPISVRPCAEGVIVSRVVDGLADGPRVGDRILAIDGEVIGKAIAGAEESAFGSTAGMRRAGAVVAALRTTQDEVALKLESPEGAERSCPVRSLPEMPPELRTFRPGTAPSLDWPADRIARLKITTFTVADWEAWQKARLEQRDSFLAESRKRIDAALDAALEGNARALILDLRGNSGGTDLLAQHLAERLMDKPFEYFRLSARVGGTWSEPGALPNTPRAPHVAAPLVALCDERVFSTTDNLLRCLRDLRPDLVVIGRPSGAGTGAPTPLPALPNSKAVVTLCAMRVFGPSGGLIEGTGTTPDVAVTWTRRDVLEGRDPDLAAALERLGSKGAPVPQGGASGHPDR